MAIRSEYYLNVLLEIVGIVRDYIRNYMPIVKRYAVLVATVALSYAVEYGPTCAYWTLEILNLIFSYVIVVPVLASVVAIRKAVAFVSSLRDYIPVDADYREMLDPTPALICEYPIYLLACDG